MNVVCSWFVYKESDKHYVVLVVSCMPARDGVSMHACILNILVISAIYVVYMYTWFNMVLLVRYVYGVM